MNEQELSVEVNIKETLAFHQSQNSNARILSSKGPDYFILD
jgi:hypothetical protein